ncbi:STAS/SEC14 domain-containing protein [Aestuariicella sp. G3-2]|uniref:STAS/SEC14 domain-containing protein n=1 Tax=Pseudomaricurvus albidus TaxID=2842452 RepID=UPI001C0AE58D|nr:STAS/SEC14 domain-containing protein [Aestuariicella albida]MBU3068920.1 STAS/SEC14 domain-containing protein [Aestuariicella albida]
MQIEKHGLSVGIERVGKTFFLMITAVGKLTHEDYEIMTPMIDSALEGVKDPTVNVLFDASGLEGWEARAAWDDFKLGLKHGNAFNKIALCTNKRWLEVGAKIAGWFVSGEVKTFDSLSAALNWLNE